MAEEARLEQRVKAYCEQNGILFYKFTSPGRRGVTDRMMIKAGKVVFVEFKRPGQVPNRLQQREIDRLHREGIPVAWFSNFPSAVVWINSQFTSPTYG